MLGGLLAKVNAKIMLKKIALMNDRDYFVCSKYLSMILMLGL